MARNKKPILRPPRNVSTYDRLFFATIATLGVLGAGVYVFCSDWNLTLIFAVLLVSISMMYYSVLNILNISYKKRLYDLPDERRIHKIPTPRLGGTVFAPIICFSTVFALSLLSPSAQSLLAMSVSDGLVLICPLTFVYLIGIRDDLVGASPRVKFTAQVMTAMLVAWSGLWFDDLHGLLGIHGLPAAVGMPLTVLFIATVINALNMIDGLDGLASGLCMIAAVFFGVWFFAVGDYLFAWMAFATLGCLIPFFYTNVRGLGPRRRKLFMGDTGSQTMGLVLSMLAVAMARGGAALDAGAVLGGGSAAGVFVPAFSPLLVPVFDILHVVIFRLKRGFRPFSPDKTHLHHRLLARGFNQRQTLALILGLAAGFVAVDLLLARTCGVGTILAVDAALWIAFNSPLLSARRRTRSRGVRNVACEAASEGAAQAETHTLMGN